MDFGGIGEILSQNLPTVETMLGLDPAIFTDHYKHLADAIDLSGIMESLSRWFPANLSAVDLDEAAALALGEGIPMAWVPRREIVDLLIQAHSYEERAVILETQSVGILEDCPAVLEEVNHEWGRQTRLAISAYQAGFESPAQSHAGNVIDSIVLQMLGRSGRTEAKKRAEEDWDELSVRLATEALALRPLVRAYKKWYPDDGAPPPGHFARHATAHAVGHPELFQPRYTLVALMLATSLARTYWEDADQVWSSGESGDSRSDG